MPLLRKTQPTAIVAAGTKLKVSAFEEVRKTLALTKEWQRIALDYSIAIGELGHAADLRGDAMARLPIFVAERPGDPSQAPEPASDELQGVLRRLNSAPVGLNGIKRELGWHFTVTGEMYLVGLAERDGKAEQWFVASIEEVDTRTGIVKVRDPDMGTWIQLSDDDFFARIWKRSPRRSFEAHSPFRGILSSCEELLIWERMARSTGRSRIARNGILAIAEEFSFGNIDPATEMAGDGEAKSDPFNEELEASFMTPIQDESSAAAVMPPILRAKLELIRDGIRFIELTRTMDEQLIPRVENLMRRIAQGVNLPVEFIFGLGEANHWGAGQIEEGDFRHYLEPLAIEMVDALTNAYLVPALQALGVANPTGFMVWYEPSGLTTDAKRRDQVFDALKERLISEAEARAILRLSEDAAPDEEEREKRLAEEAVLRGRPPPPMSADDPTAPSENEPEDGPEETSTNGHRPERRVVIAAEEDLGAKLLAIDLDLRSKLQGAADATLRRALERAANVLRSRARKDSAVQASIRGVSAPEVAATMGRAAVAALASPADLVGSSIDDLSGRFHRWVGQSQAQALDLVPELSRTEREELETQQVADRDTAWEWFSTALTELAMERLFDPRPQEPEQGEVETDVLVPMGLVREALARAGGEGSRATVASLKDRLSSAARAFGIATGSLVRRALSRKGVKTTGYVWIYGAAPRQTFPPHLSLDGTVMETLEDQTLTNGSGFPPTSHYHPGDHTGCLCSLQPITVVSTLAPTAV